MRPAQAIFDAIGAQLVLAQLGGEPPMVGDDYAIEAIVGGGGFGLICRATKRSLERTVALKLFAAPDSGHGETIREALREARSLARLEHPGIVHVYAAAEGEVLAGDRRLPCAYVEMEFVDGQTLRDWQQTERPDARTILGVLLDAGRALAHAHAAGLLHRDFKPENLMVDRHGRAKVIDFGLALVAESDASAALDRWDERADALGTRATGTGLVRGTPGYMAPEASQGRPRAASDQFALAVVVREALTGRHPFAGIDAEPELEPEGGEALFATIKPALDRAMSPSPADRFDGIAGLCDALEVALAPARRSRIVGIVGVAAAVVAVAALGVGGAWGLGAFDPVAEADAAGDDANARANTTDSDAKQGGGSRPVDAAEADSGRAAFDPDEGGGPADDSNGDPAGDSSGSRVGNDGSPGCGDLDKWAGDWALSARVEWTEYAYQYDWHVEYAVEVRVEDRCAIALALAKYPPLEPGQPRGEPVYAEAETVAIYDRDAGYWRLPVHYAFVDDGKTYRSEESYETVFVLDTDGDTPTLHAAFRKQNAEGYTIRTGLLAGSRDLAPAPEDIDLASSSCAAQCRVRCADIDSERACRQRDCAAYDDASGDPDMCGPAQYAYRAPLRAYASRRAVRDGVDWFAKSLENGSRARLLDQCSAHARQLAGEWFVWRSKSGTTPQKLALDLQVADGCDLRGTASVGEDQTAFTGAVTASGTWILTPETPIAAFPASFVLLGLSPSGGPALGLDTGEPSHDLRAYRKL